MSLRKEKRFLMAALKPENTTDRGRSGSELRLVSLARGHASRIRASVQDHSIIPA